MGSNLGPDNVFPNRLSVVFPNHPVTPGHCQNTALNEATTASFHIQLFDAVNSLKLKTLNE
jgi:hypothetical protein